MVSLHAALAAIVLAGTGQTVLYDFYADWCGPCRAMSPTVDELHRLGYPVQKINIDHNRALAQKYQVTGIPCFVMVADGKEIDRTVGGTTFSRLQQMCERGRQTAAANAAQTAPAAAPPVAPQQVAASAPPMAMPGTSIPSSWAAAAKSSPNPVVPANFQTSSPSPAPAQLASLTGAPPLPTGQGTDNTTINPTEPSDAVLVAATARLRIEDADGHSCGTGTIIDAREGEALILTCGHIFRDSKGQGKIEVDLFGAHPARGIPGRLISYNLKSDVGLVAIRPPGPVMAARVAPAADEPGPGNLVVSLGCNHGERPTAMHSRITSLNRYLGPPNLQISGQSVEGRSGGGIFSAQGQVVAVCNAADRTDNEAYCAALASIHSELDRAGLSHIYREPMSAPPIDQMSPAPRGALVAVTPPPMPEQMPMSANAADNPSSPLRAAAAESSQPAPMTVAEQAALNEIRRFLQQGAQVTCVIRPANAQERTQVIMLDNVSHEFLEQLASGGNVMGSRQLTSMEVPRETPVSRDSGANGSVGPIGGGLPQLPVARRSDRIDWAGKTPGWRASNLR